MWDEETGLSYNLHRYYDAGTGRYIQADPIGLAGGWNRFAYVNANPVKYIDPSGKNALLGADFGTEGAYCCGPSWDRSGCSLNNEACK
ncbi:RHS repeat-associated core domain-containing protein [Paracidovorax anthurii]|uniref:RHS repeat-associated core domain-containing protein n=1 Tax=Paracidovorax anthurii TaxID=78229 RepID=UPI001B861F35